MDATFFDAVRGTVFGGKLTQAQVDGMNALLEAGKRYGLAGPAHLDWGGWIGGTLGSLVALFASLDPVTQGIILAVLQGRWQEITLGGAVGFIVWALGQWRSWRATVKPQAVTERGTRVEVPVYYPKPRPLPSTSGKPA